MTTDTSTLTSPSVAIIVANQFLSEIPQNDNQDPNTTQLWSVGKTLSKDIFSVNPYLSSWNVEAITKVISWEEEKDEDEDISCEDQGLQHDSWQDYRWVGGSNGWQRCLLLEEETKDENEPQDDCAVLWEAGKNLKNAYSYNPSVSLWNVKDIKPNNGFSWEDTF